MGQQKIYDPTIAADRLLTVDEVNAAAKGGATDGVAGKTLGLQMPQGEWSQGEAGSGGPEDALNAFPQIAGLLAQFTPLGRTYKGAAGVPAFVDMVMQAIRGEEIDPVSIGANAAGGMIGKGAGEVISGTGKIGESFVRKSLNLNATPYANRAGETMLPKLALEHKARMTREGVDEIVGKAKQTGLGGLEELSDALEKARLGHSLGPVGGGGGIMSVVRDMFSPPRQMATGQAMAQPFGWNTSETIAPAGEAGVRMFLSWIASQLGDGTEATPEPGPRRRSQP